MAQRLKPASGTYQSPESRDEPKRLKAGGKTSLGTCKSCCGPASSDHSKWCDDCRPPVGGKMKKYFFTPEMDELIRRTYWVRGKCNARRLARRFGFPCWVIKKRAGILGATRPVKRRDWTNGDVAFLRAHVSSRSIKWIARKLGRSEASIVLKLKRLKISRRKVRGGYTLQQLKICFGVDHKQIHRWVEAGRLKMRRRGARIWYVEESDVLSFVREHRDAYRLDKVDQEWFLSLIFGSSSRAQTCCICLKPIKGVPVAERRPTGQKG